MSGGAPVVWVATDYVHAPLRRHLLDSPVLAVCGERRGDWRPVETFYDPSVFKRCPVCERVRRIRTSPINVPQRPGNDHHTRCDVPPAGLEPAT